MMMLPAQIQRIHNFDVQIPKTDKQSLDLRVARFVYSSNLALRQVGKLSCNLLVFIRYFQSY